MTQHLLDIGSENSTKYSSISVKNLEHGKKLSKQELLAGNTPSEVILDEALDEDTLIPTFKGFKTVKELQINDKIIVKGRTKNKNLDDLEAELISWS